MSVSTGVGSEVNIESRASLPPSCLLGGQGGNLSYIDTETVFWPNNLFDTMTYAGQLQDLHVGLFSDSANHYNGDNGTQPNNPPNSGCPSLLFTFGGYTASQNPISHTTVLVCNQLIDQVNTTANFLLPRFIIDPANPPLVDESTAEPIQDNVSPLSSVREYRIEDTLDSELSGYMVNGTGLTDNPLAYFFQNVLYGSDGVPPISLLGRDNVDNLKSAIEHLYRQYMAQVLNSQMRQKVSSSVSSDLALSSNTSADLLSAPSSDLPTLVATITDPTPLRLKQDNASKITLQVLLGVILFFSILALMFQSPYGRAGMRNLLVHNPCSIAGGMSLVAGSEMVERLREAEGGVGAGCETDEARLVGWVFSLGWWEKGSQVGGVGRRFGVDIGRADG